MTKPMDAFDSSAGRSADEALVDEGMRLGSTIDDANLVLVLGEEPRRTALVALGVARAQAQRRRVALGDLLGDAEPIQQLLNTDDPHGLADSFVYGVSLNKIARAVPQYGDLYVLPSGSEVPEYEEIFTNARWRRLIAGFRETGALLVIAAPADASHVADVVQLGDGAILVGGARLADVEPAKVLGRAGAAVQPNEQAAPATVDVTPEDVSAGHASPEVTSANVMPAENSLTEVITLPRPWWRPRVTRSGAIAGIVVAIGLAAIGIWFAAPLGHRNTDETRSGSTVSAAAGTVPSTLDSLRSDSANMPAAVATLTPANPADSLGSAAYAVVIARYNTKGGAQIWLQGNLRKVPGATFGPQVVRGETWYRAMAGAYPTRGQADSLLGVFVSQGVSRPDSNNLIRAPLAFLLDSVKAEAVPGLLKYYADRGEPVYALRQANGSARLYWGAYDSPQTALLDLDAIKSAGVRPVLVYRIGRVY